MQGDQCSRRVLPGLVPLNVASSFRTRSSREHQHASDLLTYGGDHFEFSTGVRVRGRCCTLITPMTRFLQMMGAERKASKDPGAGS